MNEQPTIQTITDSGNPPKTRIRDSNAAYELFENIKQSDSTAARYRCQIQGLIDGNPPYRSEELRRLGQLWRSNVNFREAESIIDTNAASIWELDMEVPYLITAKCEIIDQQRPGINYNFIIEQEYTRVVKNWPDYFFNRMLCTREMLITGIGPMFWPDQYDWRPRATKRASLLIPPDSKAAIGELELIGFRHTYQAHELFAKIKDEKAREMSTASGWNVDLIKEVIIRSAKNKGSGESQFQTTQFEAIQQRLKNNDLAESQLGCFPIRVVQMLSKEYDGTVSRNIFYEDEQLPDYLYKGPNEYSGMESAICLFMWNIGDGYYRSVKGLGHRIFPHVELSNRFINSTVDGANMSSSFILEPTGGGQQQVNLIRIGPITILPQGFRAIQQTFAPNLAQLIGVRNMMHQILNNNTGVYKKQLEGINMPERTATEVATEERKSAKLEKNQINIHYLYLDALHREMFRRITRKDYPREAPGYAEAKEFQRRCKERGVSDEAFDRTTVSATRAIGNGSAVMRDMDTREMMALRPGLDEIGKQNVLRDRIATIVGYESVDKYAPEASRDQIPTSETSLAMLENNDIMAGQTVIVGVDQPHALHWMTHLPVIMNIAQAFMEQPQSVNLLKAVPAMGIGLQHLANHLQNMAGDKSREQQTTIMQEQLKQLSKVFNEMQKAVQKQMQSAQAAQQEQQAQIQQAQQVLANQDTQMKLAEIQKNFEVKMFNAQRQNEIRLQKALQSMKLADMRAASDIQRENIKAGMQPEPTPPEPEQE